MPLQYVESLALCLLFAPFQPLLFYRMIQSGNLANVTSLFYLVPAGTAALDYLVLGNRLPLLSLGGMAGILLGLMRVLRTPAAVRSGGAERGCVARGEILAASVLLLRPRYACAVSSWPAQWPLTSCAGRSRAWTRAQTAQASRRTFRPA